MLFNVLVATHCQNLGFCEFTCRFGVHLGFGDLCGNLEGSAEDFFIPYNKSKSVFSGKSLVFTISQAVQLVSIIFDQNLRLRAMQACELLIKKCVIDN